MQLKNEFVVDAAPEAAWELLTDLAKVIPCMPGATLDGQDGDDFRGNVKIKVGPISAQFHGTARFTEQDDTAYRAVIVAAGKDPRGQATASATVHAWLEPVSASKTRVLVDTDLDITGRIAQFGRGAIVDVSSRLIGQFTENLEAVIAADRSGMPSQESAAGPVAAGAPAAHELNAIGLLAPTFLKLAAGPVLGFLLGLALGRRLRSPRP